MDGFRKTFSKRNGTISARTLTNELTNPEAATSTSIGFTLIGRKKNVDASPRIYGGKCI